MKKKIVMLIFACACALIFIVRCEDTIIEPPRWLCFRIRI